MASIKISSLPVLEADRLTKNDQFIVNDENAATTRLSWESLKQGITGSDLNFTQAIEFSGIVTITGDLNASNIYTKEQTDKAIEDAITPIQGQIDDALVIQEKLVNITGMPTDASGNLVGFYPIGTFTGSPLSQAMFTAQTALEQLSVVHDQLVLTVDNNAGAIINLNTRVNAVEGHNANQDVRLDDLEAAVGTGGSNIIDNSDNISGNTDNITALAAAVGVALGVETIDLSGTNLTELQSMTTAVGGLVQTGNVVKTMRDGNALLGAQVNAINANIIDNRAAFSELANKLLAVGQGTYGTPDELAAAIGTAMTEFIQYLGTLGSVYSAD